MKNLTLALLMSGIAFATVQSASAQSRAGIDARMAAISQCTAEAHRAVPRVEGPQDPSSNERYDVYAECMDRAGLRP